MGAVTPAAEAWTLEEMPVLTVVRRILQLNTEMQN